jgi:membrane protein implicated in regulation of membrane protease activity
VGRPCSGSRYRRGPHSRLPAKRHLRTPAQLRTGTAALVGAKGVVTERVDDLSGQVKIGGEIWSARAFMEGEVIEPGKRVEVARIEGATALVYE